MTTAARVAVGRSASRPGRGDEHDRDGERPRRPTSAGSARPASSATGVRDALLLMGMPLKQTGRQVRARRAR